MPDESPLYPKATPELSRRRKALAPNQAEAFKAFSQSVFAAGVLPPKVKQLIALAVAHVTQCPYCIHGHTRGATQQGATPEEIMEAVWIAAEMRAGAAISHSTLALDTLAQMQEEKQPPK